MNTAHVVGGDITVKFIETRFSSLALNVLVGKLRQDWAYSVLDLGRAFGGNVEFLSQYSSKICIEDLYQTLSSAGAEFSGQNRAYCPVIEYLLPYHDDKRFDVIFLWDLLDYIEGDDIKRLARHLKKFCRPGALIYAMVSTRQKIPAVPTNFKIVDKDNLLYQSCTTEQRDCQRYRQYRLTELLEGFRVNRSFLLRNGMQEYLFELA